MNLRRRGGESGIEIRGLEKNRIVPISFAISMQLLENQDDDFSPRVSFHRSGSLSCPHPSMLLDNLSHKSFSYNKLPQKPLTLTVIKLDGSSFEIKVAKTGTVAQLKQGVEAAFSHLPKKGLGRVSWPHVWGHFCLCYNGQKLLANSDHIADYAIKDGDKLHFIRHISISYNVVKERLVEEDCDADKPTISDGCEERQENGARDGEHHQADIENRQNNYDNDEDKGVITYCHYKLANLFRGLFSYQKLARSDIGMEEKSNSPRSFVGIFGSLKNIARPNSTEYDSLRETWKGE